MKLAKTAHLATQIALTVAFPAVASALPESDLMKLADSLYSQKRYQGSEIVCRRILKNGRANASAYRLLINNSLAEKQYKKAVADSKAGLKLLASDAEFVFLAAYAHDLDGQVNESNKLYEQAYKLNPSNKAHILGMTRSLCRRGKAREAVNLMKAAGSRKPDSIDLWEGLLEASLDAEDQASGRLALTKISALLNSGKKAYSVSNEALLKAAWRLLGLDPWNKKNYPELMTLFVLLDQDLYALKLNELASRKFQTDAELFAQLAECIESHVALNKAPAAQRAWRTIAKLCKTGERDARRMLAAENKSRLSLKEGSQL